MANIPIYIPTFISDAGYNPSKVLPHLYFYNNTLTSSQYYLQGFYDPSDPYLGLDTPPVTKFPYFDNYNVVTGSFPTTGSKSLLFYNEEAVYGTSPTSSVYSEYWSNYIELIYNPRTKLINASAIIPLADYRNIEQNDIVEFRGNYYHLRAINDYSLKNGECKIQLLGPILPDALNIPRKLFPKCMGYDSSDCVLACYSACECNPPCPPSQFTFSSTNTSAFSFNIEVTASLYTLDLPIANKYSISETHYPTLFTASWGDGTTSYISGSNSTAASHTYTSGSYTITLNGYCTNFGFDGSAMNSLGNVITKVNQWGSMNFGQLSFAGCGNLTSIPDGEPGLFSVLKYMNTFSNYVGRVAPPIGTIPPNLFKYSHNVGNAGQSSVDLFWFNFSITSIPEKIFYYNPNWHNFAGALGAMINLTTLPNIMFAPIPNCTSPGYGQFVNIGGMFRNDRQITSIPPNMFDNITGSIGSYALNTFNMSTTTNALTGNAPQLWNSAYSSSTWNVTDFFNNCVHLTNYASIPGGWK